MLQPNPQDLSFPKLTSELPRAKGQRTKPRESVAFAAQPPDQQDTKNKAATQAMVTNTDFYHRIRGLATVARQTVAASIGAATAATQNQLRLSGHDQHRVGSTRRHPTEDRQPPQPPHRLHNPRYGCRWTMLQQRNSSGLSANR